MNNPKWGVKRQCLECGEHFYDLKKTKIVCPKCDAPFKVNAQPKVRRAIATPEKAEAPQVATEDPIAKPGEAVESEEDKALKELKLDIPDDDDDEDKDKTAFEDVSELDEDEDDIVEVIDSSRKVDET